MTIYFAPRCKECYERLEAIRISEDEGHWWCETCHQIDAEDEKWPPDGWTHQDCHCCAGLQWGGEYPVECQSCKGRGDYYRHEKSGTLAEYPGGPLLGREPKQEDLT